MLLLVVVMVGWGSGEVGQGASLPHQHLTITRVLGCVVMSENKQHTVAQPQNVRQALNERPAQPQCQL